MKLPATHRAHLPHGYCGITTTRSPTFTRPGCATTTTSPVASCPRYSDGRPARKPLYSALIGAAWTLTTTQSSLGCGSGTSARAARRSPSKTAFFKRHVLPEDAAPPRLYEDP